jgi:hypothetical protein
VCFRGGKAPTRRNLGAASLISFVMRSCGGQGPPQAGCHGTVTGLRVRVTDSEAASLSHGLGHGAAPPLNGPPAGGPGGPPEPRRASVAMIIWRRWRCVTVTVVNRSLSSSRRRTPQRRLPRSGGPTRTGTDAAAGGRRALSRLTRSLGPAARRRDAAVLSDVPGPGLSLGSLAVSASAGRLQGPEALRVRHGPRLH